MFLRLSTPFKKKFLSYIKRPAVFCPYREPFLFSGMKIILSRQHLVEDAGDILERVTAVHGASRKFVKLVGQRIL